MDNVNLTQDLLKELFDYRDGELHWKKSGSGRKIGGRTGYDSSDGYRLIGINGKVYLAHRLIFLFHYNCLPKFLDHIDGDPSNNNIDNLRKTSLSQNQGNQEKHKSHNGKPTTSIYKGVSGNKQNKKWQAQIRIDGKLKYLGLFTSETDAAKAYNRAAIEVFGEFAKVNEEIVK